MCSAPASANRWVAAMMSDELPAISAPLQIGIALPLT